MVRYRGVPVGGGSPITIQSMTTVPAADVRRTMREIRALARAGCELVVVALPAYAETPSLSFAVSSVLSLSSLASQLAEQAALSYL